MSNIKKTTKVLKGKWADFSACFIFSSREVKQKIYVRDNDDVEAIDLLLEIGLNRQAKFLLSNKNNTII